MKAVARGIRFTLVLSTVTAAACTSDRAPSGIERSTEGLQSLVGSVTSCDVTTLQGYAKTYYGVSNNPVSADIRDLGDACRRSDQTAANSAVFAVLTDVGADAAARASVAGAAAGGGSLVNGVLSYLASYGNDTPENFAAALGARGMFRLRSGPQTTGQRGASIADPSNWRIKADWDANTLVYGYPISDATGGTVVSAPNGKFELKSLPTGQVSPTEKALIAYCEPNSPAGAFTNNWVQHKPVNAADPTFAFLADQDVTTICAEANVAVAPSRASMLLAAVDRAWSFIGPRDLFAQDKVKTGGVGGFGSDLSPHFLANLGQTVTEFVAQPTGGQITSGVVSGTGEVQVKVSSQIGSVGIPGAVVVMTVANNSGSPAGAYTSNGTMTPTPNCPEFSECATTGQDGIAHFYNLHVNKAGGYKLKATSTFDGAGVSFAISDLFQVQQP